MNQSNEKYCSQCGALINVKASACPKCGMQQFTPTPPPASDNRWLVCLLLCWFLGFMGVHRFYTGHIAIGIIQLLTVGGCGIWTIVDFIIIVTGNFRDAQGNLIKNG